MPNDPCGVILYSLLIRIVKIKKRQKKLPPDFSDGSQ
jgi:hypothetical protein